MMTNYYSNNLWHWLNILIGGAVLALTIHRALVSYAAGSLQFSSQKYGFTFLGIEAAAIYAALILGASLIIGIGWRGLRHSQPGAQ